MVRWVRVIAETRDLPLATVLAWSPALLMEEAGRMLAQRAEREALRRFGAKEPPPTAEGDLFSRAVCAFYRALEADERARKVKANNDAFAELIELGVFGG